MIRGDERGRGTPGKPSLAFLEVLPLCPLDHSVSVQVTGCGHQKSGWMRVREGVIRLGSYGVDSVCDFWPERSRHSHVSSRMISYALYRSSPQGNGHSS